MPTQSNPLPFPSDPGTSFSRPVKAFKMSLPRVLILGSLAANFFPSDETNEDVICVRDVPIVPVRHSTVKNINNLRIRSIAGSSPPSASFVLDGMTRAR